jgi:ABC-2 type transport system ATP-binding protein
MTPVLQSQVGQSHPTASALCLDGVSRSFAGRAAVRDLDLDVPRGSVYGLLGPNGSGKTTTLRLVTGILAADEGRLEVLGASDQTRGRAGIDEVRRRRLGYLPEERGLYPRMRVLDLLEFMGRIRGLERIEARQRGTRWLDRFDLAHTAGQRCRELSKGMQQKIQLITALLHDPELLILDEPFSGLDPLNQNLLEELITELRDAGTTILFSTHRLEQAERLCDHVCLMAHARSVLVGPLAELRRAEQGASLTELYLRHAGGRA